jgi:hypothetical protein
LVLIDPFCVDSKKLIALLSLQITLKVQDLKNVFLKKVKYKNEISGFHDGEHENEILLTYR